MPSFALVGRPVVSLFISPGSVMGTTFALFVLFVSSFIVALALASIKDHLIPFAACFHYINLSVVS